MHDLIRRRQGVNNPNQTYINDKGTASYSQKINKIAALLFNLVL